MADVHRLPTFGKVEREASEWIARLNADDVTAEDRVRFEAWRNVHLLHSKAFEDLSVTWQRFLNAAPLARASVFDNSMSWGPGRTQQRGWSLGLAAAVVVATLLTCVYVQRSLPMTSYRTAVGEHLAVPLPDGSFLELNSNSAARMDYSLRQRTIHLDRGEAFFRVAHDAQRPFWVTAGGGWVRAVGTEFNVYLRAASLRVTVREGTVRAGEGRDSMPAEQPDEQKLQTWVTLSGGEQADLEATSARKRELSSEELADAVAWRSGTVYFENRPLAEVAAELNRYSTDPLILEDEALRVLPVGGAFRASPAGSIALVRMLEQNFDIRVRRDAAGIHLARGAKPLTSAP